MARDTSLTPGSSESFGSYIPASASPRELTPRAVILGARDATILENNIVQTAGSAGESIAFGLGVTMPAIMILGFDLEIGRVMLVAVLGGLLGILMMIPLRRALIVHEHGILKYPEGTACAEVLKAAASKESLPVADKTRTTADAEIVNEEAASGGKVIFSGVGIGFLYQAAMARSKCGRIRPRKSLSRHLRAARSPPRLSQHSSESVTSSAPDRVDHVCRRCAGLSGADSGDQVLRRPRHWHRSAGDNADLADESGRRARGLHSIHRRGRGSSRGNYQPVSLDSHHLARIEGWSGRLTRTTWSARTRAAHRSRFVDARRYYRMPGDHRSHHGSAAITPARQLVRRVSDRAVRFSVRHGLVASDR